MARQHILLAESRPNLRHSLALMLKQANWQVSLAVSTEEALSMAITLGKTPDAIALLIADLDSASPETGRAFMHALSASGLAIPYLVLAEEIGEQTDEALKRHGCLACITKPFEPTVLLQSVRDAFARISPQDEPQPGRTPQKTNTESPAHQRG